MLKPRESALNRILGFLHPPLRIGKGSWRVPWEQREERAFYKSAVAFFGFFFVVYVLHYFFVDVPLKKEPLSLWARYRFGLASLSIISLLLTHYARNILRSFYKLPLMVTGLCFSYWQAQSMVWRSEVPYSYAIIIAALSTIAFRGSVFASVLYLCVAYAIELSGWTSRPHEIQYIYSAAFVGVIVVAVLRSRMSVDVDAFLAEQERAETQAELIEAQKELNEQIRAFLPREIYKRVESLMSRERKTVLQAMDEVLRVRETLVACIFSDIRGFTQMTKNNSKFAPNSVLPAQRAFTDLVEDYSGIPRLTGDLVFSYFDGENPIAGFQQAMLCGFALTSKNVEMNTRLPGDQQIKRYVLLSFGMANIGNIGGNDGSRDITVLGDAANILSRVDEVTKNSKISPYLQQPSLVLTKEAAELAMRMFPEMDCNRLPLDVLNVQIRDFLEEKSLFVVPVNERNRQNIAIITHPTSVKEYLVEVYTPRKTRTLRAA